MSILKRIFIKESPDAYKICGIKLSCKTRWARSQEKSSRILQDTLDLTALQKSKKIIVFLVPGNIKVNGGVMSIFSLCAASRNICPEYFCCLSTFPNGPTYIINDKFYNTEKVLRFSQIVDNAHKVQEMILHIPEYYVDNFYNDLTSDDINFLKSVPNLHINILNQNIELMPSVEKIQCLRNLTDNITQTLAHDRYATQQVCDKYNIPSHLFSVSIDITKYKTFTFEEKEKIIALSPDDNENKLQIIDILKQEFPDWEIRTIENLTFGQYMDLIGRSYVTITFGEGMDGYFNQPVYVGGVGISVYNNEFFPDKTWSRLGNVFPSYSEMAKQICKYINRLSSDKDLYYKTIARHREKLNQIYQSNKFISNITRFYNQDYDFTPSSFAANKKRKNNVKI